MKKKLLVLTGCNGDVDIIKYAKSKGVTVYATDYHIESYAKSLADYSFNISTTDISGIENIIKKNAIDGVTTGTSETSMYSILKISSNLNLPFYTNEQQLEIINDKKKFKDLLINHGLPVTPQVTDMSKVTFPVIVKPVDSSGSKGISVCRNNNELNLAIQNALKYSRSDSYIVEELVSQYPEVFFNYTIVDGNFSMSCAFDNYKNRELNGFAGDAVFNMYPSKNINLFKEKYEDKLISALQSIGVSNGVISIQSFFNGSEFMIYEAGYRLGGTQSYIMTDYFNNINHMHLMVNYALTGSMTDDKSILNRDNPFFRQPACQKNISIGSGIIKEFAGLDEIKKLDGILNVTEVSKVGDTINLEPFRRKLAFRIHMTAPSLAALEEINHIINNKLKVISEDGEDMILEKNKLKDYISNAY